MCSLIMLSVVSIKIVILAVSFSENFSKPKIQVAWGPWNLPKFCLKNLEKGPKNPKRDLENPEILVEKSEYTLLCFSVSSAWILLFVSSSLVLLPFWYFVFFFWISAFVSWSSLARRVLCRVYSGPWKPWKPWKPWIQRTWPWKPWKPWKCLCFMR